MVSYLCWFAMREVQMDEQAHEDETCKTCDGSGRQEYNDPWSDEWWEQECITCGGSGIEP